MSVTQGALVAALLLAAPLQRAAPVVPLPLERHELTRPYMGTQVRIVLYAADARAATAAADAAFARIGELDLALSDYRESSELMRLSRQSGGGAVTISHDLFRVLRASQQLFRRSSGAFDVTVGPLSVVWRRARRLAELPDPEWIEAARAAVSGNALILDERHRTATLTRPGMRLDLGGIAKGFAADEAAAVLAQHDVASALVAVGGDIRVTGPPPGRQGWQIAIAPFAGGVLNGDLILAHAAVSTSGDVEQYVELDGVRYSHIIDPISGRPTTRRMSVTVVAPDAMSSDGIATAVAVLGAARGLRLVEDTPRTAALAIEEGPGGVRAYESARWSALRTSMSTLDRTRPLEGERRGHQLTGNPASIALATRSEAR